MPASFGIFWRAVWHLTRPYWVSEERWSARLLLAAIVGLNLGLVYLNVLFNAWNNLFYNALQALDLPAFYHQIIRFSILATLFIIAAVYQVYLNQMLQIRWRRWMTDRFIGAWLEQRAYYRMQLEGTQADNPDQRIAEDLRLFIDDTLALSLGLSSAVVTLGSFILILWQLSGPLAVSLGGHEISVPGYMVWAALVYAILGSWLTHWIGRPLIRLNFDQQRYEADFRFAMMRLRENAEGVALYRGEAAEAAGFGRRFAHVVTNWWAIMVRQKRLTWLTAGYGQLAVIFPIVVAAPRYFAGQMQLGGLMQTASAFGQVQGALSWFVDAYPRLAAWQATVERLNGFEAVLARTKAGNAEDGPLDFAAGEDGKVSLDHLRLALPGGRRLLDQTDLAFAPGESVLITGPSGSGKSTLLRAIAGIWPFASGRVRLPQAASALFLPQRPYLPLGTLRQALSFPAEERHFADEDMRRALTLCRLAELTERLDDDQNWSQALSPGEQQRLAIARALLQRPAWLFLDEATSALDPATERHLYDLIREHLPETAVISISHHASLGAWHQRHVEFQPEQASIPGQLIALPTPAA